MVRLAAFALAQQPLTRFLLTPVRMDSIANLEVTGELGNEFDPCSHNLSRRSLV